MGNRACTIAIQTDNQFYSAGSIVSGKVYLSVNDENGVTAHAINICFNGEERATIHYTETEQRGDCSGHGNGHGHGHNRHGDNYTTTFDHFTNKTSPICHLDVPINNPMKRHIPKGQYEFPFEFQLPANIPSSMNFKHTHNQSRCEISYHIYAYLDTNGNKNNSNYYQRGGLGGFDDYTGGDFMTNPIQQFSNAFHNKNIYKSTKQFLTITSNAAAHQAQFNHQNRYNSPVTLPSECQRINYWCCINKGFITLSSEIENDIIIKGRNYNLSYSVDNQSTTKVKTMKIILWQIVKTRANGMEETSKIPMDIVYQPYDETKATTTAGGTGRRTTHLDGGEYNPININNETGNEMSYERNVAINFPRNTKESHYGNLIQVTHSLQLIVKTECCMTNPESSIDVSIVNPDSGWTMPTAAARVPTTTEEEGGMGIPNEKESAYPEASAPPAPEESHVPTPSAPPSYYNHEEEEVLEAMVLPQDWSPVTADVVVLPVAQVVSLDDNGAVASGGNVPMSK